MNTAAYPEAGGGMNEGGARIPRFMNFGTVAAIIRKDMRTLWPLAAGLAALTFVGAAFFHQESDFPDIVLGSGDIQLRLASVLFVACGIAIMVGTALFTVMLVQQDKAVDPVNDWMYRPIRAGEIVMAKALTVLAVVMAPQLLGDSIYAISHGWDLLEFVATACTILVICSFLLVLGWLCSGPFQALLAGLGLGLLLLGLVSVSVSISRVNFTPVRSRAIEGTVEIPPAPLPAPAPPTSGYATIETPDGIPFEAGLLFTLLIFVTVASAAVVLWLLLGRRQVLAARLTFLGIYIVVVLGFMTTVRVVDRSVAIPVATLDQRLASFTKNDTNGDGKLDKAEYQLVLNELGFPNDLENFWAQRDRDGDGFLSLEEMKPEVGLPGPPAASLEQRMEAFTKFDADHDNRLTKEEYTRAMRSLGFGGQVETYWPLRDLDKDGFVTITEYVPAIQGPPVVVEQPKPAPVR